MHGPRGAGHDFRERPIDGAVAFGFQQAGEVAIGENADDMRATVCDGLTFLGIKIDKEYNKTLVKGKEGEISTPDSKVRVFVLPTNEELVIARDTKEIVTNLKK